MARSKGRNWLDEAIAKTAPSPPPHPDFRAWRKAHVGALDALRRRGRQQSQEAPRVVRAFRSPLVRLAIAAAILAASFLLARHLVERASTPLAPDLDLVQGAKPESSADTGESQAVLAQVERLTAEGDTEGLLVLLETDRVDVRVLVVEYLGRTADENVLPVLEQVAARTPDSSGGNAARRAIDQIRRRAGLVDGSPNTQVARRGSGESVTRIIAGPRDDRFAAGAGDVVYRGRVTEPRGKPISGVRVWGMALTADLRRRALGREAFTNADGRFQLAASASDPTVEASRMLHFDHADYAMGWCLVNGGETEATEDIDIILYAPAEFGGTVVDSAGRPVATALVEAQVRAPRSDQADALRLSDWTDSATRANDRGQFVLRRLPVGSSVRLTVSADRHAAKSTQWYRANSVDALTGGHKGVTIALGPGRSVVGRVVYDDGRPYGRRALIEMDAPDVTNLIFATDDTGRFTSPGVAAGECVFTALRSEDRLLSVPVDVHVDFGSVPSEVELRVLGPGVPVEVRTVDEATGIPLSDVLVHAMFVTGTETTFCARTDKTGRCTLRMPVGKYRLVAEGWKDGHFKSFSQPLTVEAGPMRSVQMRMTGRTKVLGRLMGPDGRGVQGVAQLRGQPPTETGPDGWFAVDEPLGDPCEYHVLWACDRLARTGRMIAFRMADYTDALTIELEPCANIVGRAVDPAGRPLTEADYQLTIDTPDGPIFCYGQVQWTSHMDPGAFFAFANVPVGLPVRVVVEQDDWQGEVTIPQLPVGRTLDVGNVVAYAVARSDENLDWTGLLEGTIRDEKGLLVNGADVVAHAGRESFRYGLPPMGGYRLTGLPIGVRLTLEVTVPDRGRFYRYAYADSDDGDMRVRLHGLEMLGRQAPPLSAVRLSENKPIAMDDLHSKVVLLQVGTLLNGTSNPLGSLQMRTRKYRAYGLETIAVCRPSGVNWSSNAALDMEFLLRRREDSLVVCQDVARQTWTAYHTDLTPTLYLIDREGYVRISPTERDLKRHITTLLAE